MDLGAEAKPGASVLRDFGEPASRMVLGLR